MVFASRSSQCIRMPSAGTPVDAAQPCASSSRPFSRCARRRCRARRPRSLRSSGARSSTPGRRRRRRRSPRRAECRPGTRSPARPLNGIRKYVAGRSFSTRRYHSNGSQKSRAHPRYTNGQRQRPPSTSSTRRATEILRRQHAADRADASTGTGIPTSCDRAVVPDPDEIDVVRQAHEKAVAGRASGESPRAGIPASRIQSRSIAMWMSSVGMCACSTGWPSESRIRTSSEQVVPEPHDRRLAGMNRQTGAFPTPSRDTAVPALSSANVSRSP